MGGLIQRIRTWWAVADRTQRTVTVAGAAFLGFLLFGTFMFASKPRMDVLAAGLSPAEQGVIMQELQKLNVPGELNAQGMVTVPSDRVMELRAKLAMAGKLPAEAHDGASDYAKMSMMITPQVEREQLKSITEGKLQSTLEYLDGVESAQIHISLSDAGVFAADRKPATASVTIGERPGVMLTPEVGRSIAVLVANSVPNLDVSGVSVVNKRGEMLFDGSSKTSDAALGTSKLEAQHTEAKKRERELQQRLDLAFGPGATTAMVDVDLDMATPDFHDITHPKVKPTITGETQETMPTGGSASPNLPVSGLSGNLGNTPTAGNTAPPPAYGGQIYTNKQTQYSDPVVDVHETRGKETGGKLVGMSINVLVDSTKVPDSKSVSAFIDGYMGPRLKADPQHFSTKVTPVAFDTSLAKDAAKATSEVAGKERMQQIFSLLPIGALVLVGFLVIKSLGKFGGQQQVFVATPDGQVLPVPHSALTRNASMADLRAAADSPMEMQALAAMADGQPAPLPKKKKPRVEDDDDDEDEDVKIKKIKAKLDMPLEQIKLMSQDKPEVVAMLIKSWLLEEGIRR